MELTGQRISACNANPGFGLNPFQGRGAPEMDILEVMSGMHGLGTLNNEKIQVESITYKRVIYSHESHY